MSKRTIALILALLVITIILLAAALANVGQNTLKTTNVAKIIPTPTPFAHSILSFAPNQITLTPGSTTPQTVNILLNTGGNDVTGVQVELSYQPKAFSSIQITNGTLFANPFVILPPRIDPQEGIISYAYGITPAQQSHRDSGVVATLTFIPAANPVDGNGNRLTQTAITFLPKSVISARGIDQSVMNKTTLTNSLTIHFGASSTSVQTSIAPTK